MAITQTYLYTSIDRLKTFLGTLVPKYFASVEYTDDTNTGVTCKDSDGNTIFTVEVDGSNWIYTAYADSENHISKSDGYIKPVYGYTCANGAMIVLATSNNIHSVTDMRGGVIISKTNNGKTGFVIGGGANYSNIYSTFNTCSWGDAVPLISDVAGYRFSEGVTNQTQTLMLPFITHCALGEKSYFPNAFFIPVAQTRTVLGELVTDGVKYLTNGYWAIKDE